jgi:hypothetical protein
MKKISRAEIGEVLREAAGLLRALAEENEALTVKVASLERREQVEKLAHVMHAKGYHTDVPVDDLADSLEKAAERGELPVIEQAMDLVGKRVPLGELTEENVPSGSAFERFLHGDVG